MLLASFVASIAVTCLFDECKSCKPDDLCGVHQEAEQKALKELRGKLQSKDVAQREKALAEVAALTKAHENAPSRGVADTLAIALDDESFGIRAKAANFLVDGQHPDAAVKALTKALDDVREEFSKIGRRAQERGGGEHSILSGDGKLYVDAVVGGLAKLPDDRSVEALCNLLKQLPADAPSEAVLPVARALEQLGAREGIQTIVQRMVTGEGTNGGGGGGGARNGGGGAGGGGGGGSGGGKGGGGAGGGGRGRGGPGDRNGDGFKDRGADEGQKKELHQTMTEAASSRKIAGDAPKYDSQVAQAWKQWLEKHAGAFPAKLGHVGSTPLPKNASENAPKK
jgi:hypothetical protein